MGFLDMERHGNPYFEVTMHLPKNYDSLSPEQQQEALAQAKRAQKALTEFCFAQDLLYTWKWQITSDEAEFKRIAEEVNHLYRRARDWYAQNACCDEQLERPCSEFRPRLKKITKAIHDATGYKLYLTKKATTAEKFRQIRAMVAELELDGDWPLKLKPGQQVIRGEEPYTWKLVSEAEAAQPAVVDSQATLQGEIEAKEAELTK